MGRGDDRRIVGAAAALAHRWPDGDDNVRRGRGARCRHGDAAGREGPERPGPVRIRVQRLPARHHGRHRRGRPRGRPAGTGRSLHNRDHHLRHRADDRGAGSVHAGAGGRPGAAGTRRRSGACRGLRRYRAQPARPAAGADDGRALDRVGGSRPGRPGPQRRGSAAVRMAVGISRPAALHRPHRPARHSGPGQARPLAGARQRRAPADRRYRRGGLRRPGAGRAHRGRWLGERQRAGRDWRRQDLGQVSSAAS